MSRNGPGEDVAISLDGRPPNWATTDAICWGSKSANSIATVWRRCYSGGARYPIISIEDPFAEDDLEGFQRFTAAVSERVQVIGDDLLGTNAARVREKLRDQSANAVLIKVNQAGTVSDAAAACNEGRRAGFGTMVSASAGETEDTSIVHLAIGLGAGQLKIGSFSRSERMAKWNQALRIEEALGAKGRLAGLDTTPSRRMVSIARAMQSSTSGDGA